MQCIYMDEDSKTNVCLTGVTNYATTEEDRMKYCRTEDFLECPRLKATFRAKEADGTITTIHK